MENPITRKESFLNDIATGAAEPTLTPITDKERALAAMITGNTEGVAPLTRKAKAYLEIAKARAAD